MHPIIAALRHHKTAVVLVALEIAMTCAIVTNALSLIGDRVTTMQVNTGVSDNELVWATPNFLNLGEQANAPSGAGLKAADFSALREMPGVKSVAMADALPLNGVSITTGLYRRPGEPQPAVDNVTLYLGTPGILKTLGVQFSAGRAFKPQEFVDYDPFGNRPPPLATVITRQLAEKLWPGQNPLGKPIYLDTSGKQVTYVVGVAKRLLNSSITGSHDSQLNLFLPVKDVAANPTFVLRVAPDQRRAVAKNLSATLRRVDAVQTTTAHVYTDTVSSYFHGDRAMVEVLVAVIVCLLAVAALGVVGLSSFWVQQRTKAIGIRRALGATRGDILHYFQTENFLIVTFGVVLGVILAIGMNLLLMQHYAVARMPLWYLPIGAAVLWVLGQLAVLAPALRASHVSPMVATRSV